MAKHLTMITQAERGLSALGHHIDSRDPISALEELKARAIFVEHVVRAWVCQKCHKVFMLHKTPSSNYVTKHIEQFYSSYMFDVKKGSVYDRTFFLKNKVDRYYICDRLKNLA